MNNDNILLKRRLDLIKKEALFRQQSGELQKMGDIWALHETNIDIKRSLRNLDLIVWDESEKLLHNFSKDLKFAPYHVLTFLSQIAEKGREFNLEFQLPTLVAAFSIIRICAGGKDVRKKHEGLMRAIINSQKLPQKRYEYFNNWCTIFKLNKLDPAIGEETIYRRGDPMERVKDTEEAKAEARIENLLGQILEATKGWNVKAAFGDYWEQWTELWVYLLKQEEMVEKVSKFCPNSKTNHTEINIKLVFNVAGLLKKHLEKPLICKDFTDTSLANLTKKAWSSVSSHKEIGFPSELIKKQIDQINDWLAMNIK